ncbi:MAG TPA: hypothetical protein VJZ75_08165 [Candidatus Bathyarchaeia archaeon]|nr:hypothetical protein [Candidatus Bathyarchaeia archaeon]
MKKRNLVIFSLAFFLAAATFAATSSPVFAQTTCIAQASYPAVSTPQYNSNIAVTVPVSTSCSYIVGPLFAVGDAYDTTISTDLGTVSTGLSSVGGGSYTGQLLFSLPTSTQGHTVQFSVSIYNNNNGQYGSPLATTSQSITIGSSYYQSYPYNYCQSGYAYTGGTCYPSTYYSNCQSGYYYTGSSCYYYPGYYSNNYYSSNYYGSSSNGNGNGNWNHGNGNNNWNNGNGNGNGHHKSP